VAGRRAGPRGALAATTLSWAALLPLLFLAAAGPARAQPAPACGSASNGVTACMAGKLCRCGYQRGGSISAQPTGWHWDCGVLRPACDSAQPPATLPGSEQPPMVIMPQITPGQNELPDRRPGWR
jgi:hypothetical protein